MKKTLLLILITAFFLSCNSQTKDSENAITSLNPPYNEFKEGEVEVNFQELMADKKDEIKTSVDHFKYNYPSETVFNTKVEEFFNLDLSAYDTDIIALRHSLMPEIAIKSLKLIYVDYDSDNPINGELLFNYNEYLFYHTKSSFEWLKKRHSYLLKELVTAYGYSKDQDLLEFVFSNTDFSSQPEVEDLLFTTEDFKYSLRKEMLKKIREVAYDNQEILGFSEVIDGEFYHTLLPIINNIQSNRELYHNPEESIAVLLNEMAMSGITGGIDSFLNNNSSIIQIIEKKEYFGQRKLQEYISVIFEKTEVESYGQIIDPDGHTNLREKPSSNSEILLTIDDEERLQIISKEGLWYKVKTNSGQTGYVHNSRLKID